MRLAVPFVFLSGLLTAVSAHFHLQYPPPRGPWNMPNELTFCDAYGQATTNRTEFPLNGAYYSLTSEHPLWILGVLISTVPDPDNFANFSNANGQQQLVVQYFETSGEGEFCAPIDIAAAKIPGVQSGVNATLQFVFDGGDGELYQCADVTLVDSSEALPTNGSCTNATQGVGVTVFSTGAVPTITLASTTSASGSASATATHTSGASARAVAGITGLIFGVAGAVLSVIA